MGRRSSHTPEELRQLILEVSTTLISDGGMVAFSAREVARRIGYSAGTIYNVFHNLDELLLIIQGRLLDELSEELDKVSSELNVSDKVLALAHTYLNFTATKPRLHGISSLATAQKLTNITSESAVMLVDHLVCTFLNGLKSSSSS